MQGFATRPLAPLFRDLAEGLNQQMFFWGRDVTHPLGNLLVRAGFEKRPSPGLQGTSCYRLPWQQGAIELHGSYAGWLGPEGGLLFIRPLRRCVRWLDSEPPIAGEWPRERFSQTADLDLHAVARPFLDWWLAHEHEVQRTTESTYRTTSHRQYGSLPRTRAWLSPERSRRWITGLRDLPDDLPRARRFSSKLTP